jgi:hypothetical protein
MRKWTDLEDRAFRRTYQLMLRGTLYAGEMLDAAWFIEHWMTVAALMYHTTLIMDAYRVDVLEMVR